VATPTAAYSVLIRVRMANRPVTPSCRRATLGKAVEGGIVMSLTTEYLEGRGVPFDVVPHDKAFTSIDEARALGIRVAALSADPLGEGLYRKLGFREVSRHLTYVWSPER